MKKFLVLILLCSSVVAYADDTVLVCKVVPALEGAPKDFSGIETIFTIQNNGTQIKFGTKGANVGPLTTTDTSYEWQRETAAQGKERVIKESINRLTGSYSMVFFVDGNGRQMSRGECVKGVPKL